MGSRIAKLHYIIWRFSFVRLAKRGYYCLYSTLPVQARPSIGHLEHNAWQKVWQDFQISIFPFLTFCFLFEIFHGRNFLTNSGHKYISMNLLQYSAFYPNPKEKKWYML